jgi:hypothetical protein
MAVSGLVTGHGIERPSTTSPDRIVVASMTVLEETADKPAGPA